MASRGCLCAVQLEGDHAAQVLSTIKQHYRAQQAVGTSPCEPVVLGTNVEGSQSVVTLTLSELFIHLWRRHRLHANERRTVVSAQDQMVVVQLCLAAINKQVNGDFDVEASKVVEMHRALLEDKMAAISPDSDVCPHKSAEYIGLREAYDQFLKYCNMVDVIDVLEMVKKEMEHNSDLKNDVKARNYILINKPQAPIEMEMLRLIEANTIDTRTVTVATSLDGEVSAGAVDTQAATLEELVALCEDGRQPPNLSSVTQSYAEEVIMAYLQLLVNSRSELALARALNVPDRDLDHKAFTALKKAAKEKSLSMFQTASSFIIKLRLGGRGYAPCPNDPLSPHVKGLGEFVDLLHRIQTIIEEDPNCSNAVNRVINIVKNTIVKHRDNVLRRVSVEEAAVRLQEHATRLVTSLGSTNSFSPQRPASIGGSMMGRDTLRVLRHLVDSHAGIPMAVRSVDILSDVISSQKTPLRFPCLLSKFRSPVECSPDDKISKSLAERLLEKIGKKPKVVGVPRYQASYDWAQPGHDDTNTNLLSAFDSCLPSSSTLVHPAPSKSKAGGPRRIAETRYDQENAPTGDAVSVVVFDRVTNGKRRAIETVDKPAPPAKKRKPTAAPKKPVTAKTSKKKMAALQKGQRPMTAFFRV